MLQTSRGPTRLLQSPTVSVCSIAGTYAADSVSIFFCRRACRSLLRCQYLYVCPSKASKLSTQKIRTRAATATRASSTASICSCVLVKEYTSKLNTKILAHTCRHGDARLEHRLGRRAIPFSGEHCCVRRPIFFFVPVKQANQVKREHRCRPRRSRALRCILRRGL